MKKLLTYTTALLTCLCLTAISEASDLDEKVALKLIKSTVRVNTPSSHGSGVILWSGLSTKDKRVKKTYIITNYHVVKKNKDVNVDAFMYLKNRNTVGKSNYLGAVVFRSQRYDLALIEIKTDPTQIFKPVSMISDKKWDQVKLYEKVYLVSCGLRTPPYITNGNLSSVNKNETKMEFTSNIIFGSSGGGIYNDKGELVGIGNAMKMTSRGQPVSHHAMGVPISTVKKFLGRSKHKFILKNKIWR